VNSVPLSVVIDFMNGLNGSNMSFFYILFWSKINIVYLCSEVNCLYISNAKLIDFGEISVSLSSFYRIASFPLTWGLLAPKPLGVFRYRYLTHTRLLDCISMLNLPYIHNQFYHYYPIYNNRM
jgi:hypothetical protein